uniref:hypothetical protein n=1 Tax=uncultured Dysgonomonas sp. TaxID=206096 RepID=UPI0026145191|nr:hypothetical protein [uncultured Dysgonomonas sp.]
MEPVNNKSLLHFIYGQMQKLDSKEITVEDANAQANLAKQANNAMVYELKRSELLLKLEQARKEGVDIGLREVESKVVNSTTD